MWLLLLLHCWLPLVCSCQCLPQLLPGDGLQQQLRLQQCSALYGGSSGIAIHRSLSVGDSIERVAVQAVRVIQSMKMLQHRVEECENAHTMQARLPKHLQ
jgi:Ni,Fe-hydrogenase III large subunit